MESAIAVYTSELDDSAVGSDPDALMKERLALGKERLDNAIESLLLLCKPVAPLKEELDYIHYFCGNTELPEDLLAHEPQRVALYKGAASLVRAYANIAEEMAHLLEPLHNSRFVSLMNTFMAKWRHYCDILNQLPERYEQWRY